MPRIDTEFTSWRIAPTAAPSPPSLSPRPTQRPAAMAPASVTRTSSRARLRSGASRREAALMVADCPREGLPLGSWDTRACDDAAGADGQTGQAPAAAGRPGHVLVDRAAGSGLHRAGGHGRDVLVFAGWNKPRTGAALPRLQRPT